MILTNRVKIITLNPYKKNQKSIFNFQTLIKNI